MEEAVAGEENQINKLPDGLLVKILSHLPTIDDAIETRLVCKRWQFLWTFTDNITLFPFSIGPYHPPPFVEYVFAHLSSSKIRKFHLSLEDMSCHPDDMERWLGYLIQHKVEHVSLWTGDVHYYEPYTLPQLLCTCSSLVALELTCCEFDKGAVISWKSLKRLHIRSSEELVEETIQKILSGCPALESLELWYCTAIRRLEIQNSNLKRLALNRSSTNECILVEISAPYLHQLEIRMAFDEISIVDVSSLVSAVLDYHYTVWHTLIPESVILTRFQDCLRKFRQVTHLTITTWFAEVLFMLHLDRVQLPDMKCKCLTLSMQMAKYGLYGVVSFLRTSPHLETLNIDLVAEDVWPHCRFMSSYLHKGDNIDLESLFSNFTFPYLKSVTVRCLTGIRYEAMCQEERHDKLFELSEFLLKNAMVLEKFVFIAKRWAECRKCPANCASQYLSNVTAKLLDCPRPSTKTVISFRESDFI